MNSHSKIALLGGSGFIGTKLTSLLLKSGHHVTIGDIEQSRKYPDLRMNADVRDYATLIKSCEDCDTIINLAAAHRDDIRPISLYYDTNVTGAKVTCEVAEKLGIQKIIFTSSVAVYGHQEGEADENSPHHPIGPYGETKSQAEDVYKKWHAVDPQNRTLVIVRPTVVFGPGNRGNVHNLMDQIAKGNFIMVGSGENRKSMAYVENVAGFINYSLSLDKKLHIFNYIDKPDYSMNDLVSLITKQTKKAPPKFYLPKFIGLLAGSLLDVVARITGKTLPISRVRIEKFCATTIFNADKVQSSGYKPLVSLEDGLIQTIDAEFAEKTSNELRQATE
jgi:nucleoside-diphosphate-sugar epimerase